MHEQRESLRIVPALGVAAVCVALALADTFATLALGWVCPASLSVAVAVLLGALAAYSVRSLGAAAAVLAAVGTLAFFGGLYLWPMTPRKLFFRDMQRVELGMSRSEVRAIATRWRSGMPAGLSFGLLDEPPPHFDVFHHGQGGQMLSSDHCRVRYEGDAVAEVEFLFD